MVVHINRITLPHIIILHYLLSFYCWDYMYFDGVNGFDVDTDSTQGMHSQHHVFNRTLGENKAKVKVEASIYVIHTPRTKDRRSEAV